MRRIFSTVFGPHEPALTVGSFAISATGRPSIVAIPVTTPSAPSPSSSQFASRPSSENEPGSTRRSTRPRTGSLPCSAVFSWWRRGPPARAASRASWKSDMETTGNEHGRSLFGPGPMPVDGPGPEYVRSERAAEHVLGGARGLHQAWQVDTGVDPHL